MSEINTLILEDQEDDMTLRTAGAKREQSENEWVEVTEPRPTKTGIACATCGEVLPKRKFISRNKLTSECPTCRRRRSNREAQKRHYAKVKAEHGTYLNLADRAVKDMLAIVAKQANVEIRKNVVRIKQMEKIENPMKRTVVALERRRVLQDRLLRAKEEALRATAEGARKPFFEYIQQADVDIVDGEI